MGRRKFLAKTVAGVGGLVLGEVKLQAAEDLSTAPAGSPPAFGTASGIGPEVSVQTFQEAEKLVQVSMSPAHLLQAANSWRENLSNVYGRRTGPKKVDLEDGLVPYSTWNPLLDGAKAVVTQAYFSRSEEDPGSLPQSDAAIAFASVSQLSRWIESRQLSSERLTRIYLERLERYDRTLRCTITLMREQALKNAVKADAEIAAGHYRGPLHGIPWGAKDLIDTAGIATTYGAEPFRNRIPNQDAAVVTRLNQAGAILVAKLSLGALALNDVWFGGQTMNPWLPQEGSSGSSAGPGSATGAGLVGFSMGSETGGSIVSPSMRCGVTGLRPTYGRVARTGAMTLCWSLDKLGPMTRGVEDAILVLSAIQGHDNGDAQSKDVPLHYDSKAPIKGLRVGYIKSWMHEEPATEIDRNALETLEQMGLKKVEVTLPDWPYESLNTILFAESAAAFEDLTLSGELDQLGVQTSDAWPNLFRQSRFLSAVDFVQADRLRRKVAKEMERIFKEVDLLLVPSLRDEILTITNATGHPSLTMRAGFTEVSQVRSDWAPDPSRPLIHFPSPQRVPYGITLIGRLFDEGLICQVGRLLEKKLKVIDERPTGFA